MKRKQKIKDQRSGSNEHEFLTSQSDHSSYVRPFCHWPVRAACLTFAAVIAAVIAIFLLEYSILPPSAAESPWRLSAYFDREATLSRALQQADIVAEVRVLSVSPSPAWWEKLIGADRSTGSMDGMPVHTKRAVRWTAEFEVLSVKKGMLDTSSGRFQLVHRPRDIDLCGSGCVAFASPFTAGRVCIVALKKNWWGLGPDYSITPYCS